MMQPTDSTKGNTMDSRNFAIGVLSTTATILLVGLLVIHTRPTIVHASGMTVSSGAYTMTVGKDASGDQELVFVLHGPSQRLIAYRFDANRQTVEVAQGLDLSALNPSAAQPTTPAQRPGRGRRRP